LKLKTICGIWLSILMLVSFQAQAQTCTLILDLQTDKTVYRSGPCKRRYSPASTFKIPLALMGFDAGILSTPDMPVWRYQPGVVVNLETDRQDTNPAGWLANSVVWYSQQLTSALGAEKFRQYTDMFGYGNKNINGDTGASNGLSNAWLMSSLLISVPEQIEFLKKMLKRKYPLQQSAYENTLAAIPVYSNPDGWIIHGKSGSGWQQWEGGENRKLKLGWFVGWAEKNRRTLVFARLLLDETPQESFGGIRARNGLIQDFAKLVH
jgi:beta-lactamase class D